jgi:HNH endonuclease
VPREFSEAQRQKVILRAKHRCEYCLYPEGRSAFAHQVDHVVSRKHGGASALDNLAYSCIFCNRYKGSDVAAIDARTGEAVRLFHPRLQRWSDHFFLRGGIIEALTPEGHATARLLRFNHAERIVERTILQSAGHYPRSM